MFIRNRMKTDVGGITFDGYIYTIPANTICAVNKDFFSFLKVGMGINLMTVETTKNDADGNPTGGIPPLLEAEEKDWHGAYAQVTRFQIASGLIPNRKDLLSIAEKRGVDHETLRKFTVHDEIENDEIVSAINELPVPDSIRMPIKLTEKLEEKKSFCDFCDSLGHAHKKECTRIII